MSEPNVQANPATGQVNGDGGLETRLRWLHAEQWRLRVLLEQTREELDQINARVIQTQEEYCTTPEREEEYWQCLKRILGRDPQEDLRAIEEVRANPNPQLLTELIAELEQLDASQVGAL